MNSQNQTRLIYALVFLVVILLLAIGFMLLKNEPKSNTNNNTQQTNTENTTDTNQEETNSEDVMEEEDHTHDFATVKELLEHEDEENDNVSISFSDDYITFTSNGIPDHETGTFPNQYNPNTISEQNYVFKVKVNPTKNTNLTETKIFGITIGGVPFDPGTAEKDSATGWAIEAFNNLSGFGLGIDENNAHVQPSGAYHYHGIPTALFDGDSAIHSNLIGFAADGFPIYALYGYSDTKDSTSVVKEFKSSYQLKSGQRAAGEPSGSYDGTYTNDFEFVAGSGDLDQCGGIFTVTPEYPDGTYAYFLTNDFPYVPRCVFGTPDSSFETHGVGLPQGNVGGGQFPQ
ncbi:YHYH protein [Candidatus Dojkabacteria bacterium]|uniref:YHYH protein n=1 Tax=Candidatus Dojkabacteria bacterium TaxID=2099670 RepID=A0A955L1K5_9BACT|nr:YHYH protein [Candidatus Dojkabacteria bacterium]